MRVISFMLTERQIKARTKTETRRLGWRTVKVGDRLRGVLRSQGRTRRCPRPPCDRGILGWDCDACGGRGKVTDPIVDLAIVEVTEVRRERLDAITPEAVIAEGFPEMTVAEFVAMFCKHMGCAPSTEVTVITFKYVEEAAGA